jgi:hypothetical protein
MIEWEKLCRARDSDFSKRSNERFENDYFSNRSRSFLMRGFTKIVVR